MAQPQKYRSPSRKGGISPASRGVKGRAGLKLSSQPGRERPPDPDGSESAVTNPGNSKSDTCERFPNLCNGLGSEMNSPACAVPYLGQHRKLQFSRIFPDSALVKPARFSDESERDGVSNEQGTICLFHASRNQGGAGGRRPARGSLS